MQHFIPHSVIVFFFGLGACTAGGGPSAPDELSGPTPPPALSSSQAPSQASGQAPGQPPAPGPSDPTAAACAAYPLALSFAPAEAEARIQLAAFAPGAHLTWSPTRATPSELFGADAAFACDGDVYDSLFALLESHHDLFRIDRDEWKREPPFACSSVSTPTLTVNIQRAVFGGRPVHEDKVSFFLRRSGAGLVLDGLYGSHLPPATRAQAELLGACAPVATATLEATARAASYDYSTYDGCALSGNGTYAPNGADRFELDDASWVWDDAPAGVTLRRLRQGRILIAPGNLTPELMASDAYCGEDNRAGFTLTFDDVTGELVGASPGVDGCIVC